MAEPNGAAPPVKDDLHSTIGAAFDAEVKGETPPAAAPSAPGAVAAPAAAAEPSKGDSGGLVRGADGKFLPKDAKGEPAAAGVELAKPGEDVAAPAIAEPPVAPAHWPEPDRALFAKQTPEVQGWLLGRAKALEGDYTRKSAEIAPIRQVIAQHKAYFDTVGVAPERAFAILINTERQLRFGTPAQKQAAMTQIANDYGIPLAQPADNSAADTFVDPQLKAVDERIGRVEGLLTSQHQAQTTAETNRQMTEIQSFAEAKTEAGMPAHPYFTEVYEDMVAMAATLSAAGRLPPLPDLYERAIWANPQVRQKMLAANKDADARKAAEDARTKANSALKAGGSVAGAPSGAPGPASPADLRGTIEAAWGNA